MLRAAFRSKSNKDDEEKSSTSSASKDDDEADSKNQEQSADSELSSEEATTESFHECTEVLKSSKNPNKNKLTKMNNSSLDETLSNEDQQNFPYTERQIYEMQLVQLQEQLVAAMIEDQEKTEELKKYKDLDIDKLKEELKAEKERNEELEAKNKLLKNKAQNQKMSRSNASKLDPRKKSKRNSTSSDDWVDVSQDDVQQNEDDEKPKRHDSFEKRPKEKDKTSESASKEGKDRTDGGPAPKKKSRLSDLKKRMMDEIVDRVWDFVNEDQDSESDSKNDDEALTVKTLKENINRFGDDIKPITRFIKGTTALFSWKNPSFSLLALVLYMLAVLYGYLFSLLLLLVIWKLFRNFLHARGITSQEEEEKDDSSSDDKSWSDKFQLVLQVARKVQNILGDLADSLEKIKNLLTWQHPATNSLFLGLCCLFVASLILSGPRLFMLIALGLGYKVFITDPIYAKFPKVKQRYDNVAKLWNELPTDAELLQNDDDDNKDSKDKKSSDDSSDPPTPEHKRSSSKGSLSQSWANICEKLKITKTETPLPMWEDGRRCILMNKDKPLSNLKNGKLYLTQNYLCFERSKSGSSKNFAIALEEINYVKKCKPVGILPGTGMAIEIGVNGIDKPYVFGGMLCRDELFDNILSTGQAADLEWAKHT